MWFSTNVHNCKKWWDKFQSLLSENTGISVRNQFWSSVLAINQSINRSISQSINLSINQSINQSLNYWLIRNAIDSHVPGLSALADCFPADVIPSLCTQYTNSQLVVETQLKVGEVLTQSTRRLGTGEREDNSNYQNLPITCYKHFLSRLQVTWHPVTPIQSYRRCWLAASQQMNRCGRAHWLI